MVLGKAGGSSSGVEEIQVEIWRQSIPTVGTLIVGCDDAADSIVRVVSKIGRNGF